MKFKSPSYLKIWVAELLGLKFKISFYVGILIAVLLVKFEISSYVKVLVVRFLGLIFGISFHLKNFFIYLRILPGKADLQAKLKR